MGKGTGEREIRHARARREKSETHVRETAAAPGGPRGSGADELAKPAETHDRGILPGEEFQQAKVKVLHRRAPFRAEPLVRSPSKGQ